MQTKLVLTTLNYIRCKNMNRVWKKFFLKLAEPLGIVLYVSGTIVLAKYVATVLEYGKEGYAAVLGVMIFIPVIAVMLRMTWRQAKYEVDRENEEMIRTLKGE
jgi:hypothetical protein